MKIVGNHSFIKYYTETLIQELQKSTDEIDKETLNCLIRDGKNFLHKTQEDIERRTLDMMLANHSPSDFARYIRDRQDHIEMKSLRKRGFSLRTIDRWRKNIVDTILSTALDLGGGRLILNSDNPRKL